MYLRSSNFEFESLPNDDNVTKEVFAHFGLTIFMRQLIAQQSINKSLKSGQETNRRHASLSGKCGMTGEAIDKLVIELRQEWETKKSVPP